MEKKKMKKKVNNVFGKQKKKIWGFVGSGSKDLRKRKALMRFFWFFKKEKITWLILPVIYACLKD